MSSNGDELGRPSPSVISRLSTSISLYYQNFLDRATPYVIARWISTMVLSIIYGLRIYIIQGFYIVTYALAIFLLNQFIGFLTPQMDPAMSMEEEEDGPTLPTRRDEEFKPFMRRLPEFKFWTSTTRAIIIATFCTFFQVFDVPVFWPILVIYFFLLFFMTMRRQIEHMIRYRYLPFSHGKKKYKGKEDSGKVVVS